MQCCNTATTWQHSARFCSPQCLMSSHFANKLLTCKCLILSPATCGNAWCSRAGGAARFWVGTGCENWMNKILYPSLRYYSLKSHQTSLQQACSPKGQPSYTKWTGTSQLPILLLDSFDFIKNANVCFWTIVVRLPHTTESQNCGCWFRFSNYTDRSKLTTWLVWVFWCDSLILFHESQCVLGTLTFMHEATGTYPAKYLTQSDVNPAEVTFCREPASLLPALQSFELTAFSSTAGGQQQCVFWFHW